MRALPLILLLLAPTVSADDWGRLFFDAQTRSRIDSGKTAAEAPPAPRNHRLDGELRRGGQVIHFIDGEPTTAAKLPKGTRVGELWQENTQ
ncbi:hypothetical protein [Chitinolyticbacter meiyuanensis]|uniref:hypothetical protein n=1 Tax=Chitinolyticbacter meiyuanensis TaxID=682798 RepID=UPI0011E6025E|nr:hypothetical protein [Chitinolyticbacter meiyuanensis]